MTTSRIDRSKAIGRLPVFLLLVVLPVVILGAIVVVGREKRIPLSRESVQRKEKGQMVSLVIWVQHDPGCDLIGKNARWVWEGEQPKPTRLCEKCWGGIDQ